MYPLHTHTVPIVAAVPDPPADVSLHVTSNRSLTVTFTEPLETNGAVVTRYKSELTFDLQLVVWEIDGPS